MRARYEICYDTTTHKQDKDTYYIRQMVVTHMILLLMLEIRFDRYCRIKLTIKFTALAALKGSLYYAVRIIFLLI